MNKETLHVSLHTFDFDNGKFDIKFIFEKIMNLESVKENHSI